MIHTYAESRNILKDPAVIRRYLFGGRGVVTLESPSGKHHTYYFKKPLQQEQFPDDIIFVYALHEQRLFYVGMMEGSKFRITANSRFLPDTEIVRGARFIEKMCNREVHNGMKLYHEGRCCRCGRQLTDPKSIKEGIGPKCFHKLH